MWERRKVPCLGGTRAMNWGIHPTFVRWSRTLAQPQNQACCAEAVGGGLQMLFLERLRQQQLQLAQQQQAQQQQLQSQVLAQLSPEQIMTLRQMPRVRLLLSNGRSPAVWIFPSYCRSSQAAARSLLKVIFCWLAAGSAAGNPCQADSAIPSAAAATLPGEQHLTAPKTSLIL